MQITFPDCLRRMRPLAGLLVLLSLFAANAAAQPGAAAVPRHELEAHALLQPEDALKRIDIEAAAAEQRGDRYQLALLFLARANACRVIADWNCQRDAGSRAREVAQALNDPILIVRALINDSRASIALQDFSRGEHLLGEAERLLQDHPQPVLAADVYLAYSSLSYSLGKHTLGVDYADRGLLALGSVDEPAMRARLLRNRARAEAQLGEADKARVTLELAQQAVLPVNDPKLRAELYLETARLARTRSDVATQREASRKVLELAEALKNTQLYGQAHEALGLAETDDVALSVKELRLALDSFRALDQNRDELRVLRALIPLEIRHRADRAALESLVQREISLSLEIDRADRAKSSADFDSRLKYAQSEIELARLKQEAELAAERAAALAQTSRLTNALVISGAGLLVILAAFFAQQWRAKRRLQRAYDAYRVSESRYRMLADNSRDLVVRMRADGHRLYVSPSAQEMLGFAPEELSEARWELVHPDDLVPLRDALVALVREGGSARVTYRTRHRDGHYVWIEALGRLVQAPENATAPEIVYSGRDVSARVQAEQALAQSEGRLKAVTENIPALVSQFDREVRYRYANEFHRRLFELDPAELIGRRLDEVVSAASYARLQGQISAVLAGETVHFEDEFLRDGRRFLLQSHYVPDRAADGSVQGFFALTFDISALKHAQDELARLARHDSMTGVANRRHFDERLQLALARSQRHGVALTLLYLDIDRFKQINDSHGHRVGDEVIVEFARRLEGNVRATDLVARLGGDEFVVLLDDGTSADAALALATKLVAAMQQPLVTSAGELRFTTSIGVAHSHGGLDAIGLVALADKALYAAKVSGRNAYRLLDSAEQPSRGDTTLPASS